MQIVAGKYRHRKLHTNPGQTTRPITVRVKVALFDRLNPVLGGVRVADIYAGTGTLGLEALSRGARSVVFFENDRVAFELLKQNVNSLGAQPDTLCWRTDVSKTSFRPLNRNELLPFDLIFFDPPYLHTERMQKGTMLYKSLVRLARDSISSPDVLLLLRCSRETEFEMPPMWRRERRLDFPSMVVHYFRKDPAQPPAPFQATEVTSEAAGLPVESAVPEFVVEAADE